METVLEVQKEIPVVAQVDVIVLGGGPAGVSAAICAAREGVSTMVIAQSGDVGGMATTGLMSHWTGETRGGFYDEIINKSNANNDFLLKDPQCPREQVINPEKLKTVLLEMIEDAKVKLQLYTFASSPIMENDTCKGVIVESKAGRQAIMAKVVIDATGDGDIASRAGAPYFKGREIDSKMQPMTLMFKVAGVDVSKGVFPGSFEENTETPNGPIQDLGKANIPFPAGHVLLYKTTLPGVVTCNMTNVIDVDGTNPEDLTKATIICRKQMEVIIEFLKKYIQGFENCFLISSASIIGVRETRHFIGESTINEGDIINGRVFDDWAVTKAYFNFDVHNITGNGLDETGSQKSFKAKSGYTIPYGCLVPKKIENLILAGRNISGTHMAHSNYRAMPICANIGQSAGVAASICVKENCKPRNLDVKKLQKRLNEIGVTV